MFWSRHVRRSVMQRDAAVSPAQLITIATKLARSQKVNDNVAKDWESGHGPRVGGGGRGYGCELLGNAI